MTEVPPNLNVANGLAAPAGAPSEDEDDHDLLTYGIAGDRLRHEIEAEQANLATAVRDHGEDSTPARTARARLDQLREALARQYRARADHINEKEFFGE